MTRKVISLIVCALGMMFVLFVASSFDVSARQKVTRTAEGISCFYNIAQAATVLMAKAAVLPLHH